MLIGTNALAVPYLPFGPQHSLSENVLVDEGWERIFLQPYAHHTTIENIYGALSGYTTEAFS